MRCCSWIEIIFIIGSSLLIGYYLFFWRKLALYKSKSHCFSNLPFASVVICAKNEEQNLLRFLPQVLNQEYPFFEVIVVNDASSDGSMEILNNFLIEYKNLRVYTFEADKQSLGKKEILEFGISKTKSDYIVLTDADCMPNSKKWLVGMINEFSNGSQIVLGIGQYEKKDSKLNRFLQLDTGFIAMNYLSFALANFPYMSVGRNVAYKKELFNKVGGFKSHYDIASGDDDLFINELSKETNVGISISYDSQTISVPSSNLKLFFLQKVRHVSTGFKYRKINITILTLFYSISAFWYLSLPFVVYYSGDLVVILTVIVLKKLIMYSLIRRIFSKIGVSSNSIMILLTEFQSVFIHNLAVLVTIFKSKKRKW